ncbi:MAG: hypothetical protein GEU78_05210 [Actinobacteria bacterium]|nr:hypothetical protein [Actinomycetota bacterium]
MAPEPIERQILLPASPAEVWKALTDGDQVSEWFGAEVEMEPRRGGRVRFRFPDGSERGAVIETFETERLFVLRWLPFAQDAEGKTEGRPSTNVRFSLKLSEGGTLLVVQESLPALSSRERSAPDAGGYSDRGLGLFHLDARVRR